MADPIEIRFSNGINNLNTPLDLYLKKKGEVQDMVNCDLSSPGKVKRLLPRNSYTSAGSDIHSFIIANGVLIGVDGTSLFYGASLTSLATLTSSEKMSFAHVGNWVFYCNGTDKGSIYIPGPTLCDWGQDIPAAAATVAVGTAGNPDGTYSCYYRYKITLPDDTIIRTALSPVASVTVSSETIEWSDLVHASFTGATNQIELFRTATGFAATYLVATVDSGTTTYSDDIDDATLQESTAYAETGYYPPPDTPSIVKYHPGADRLFCAIDGDVYWSEAALYHTFLYSASVVEYYNVNSVFLAGEDIKAIRMIDENMYFGSLKTWRRLRGKATADFSWEDTQSKAGPINDTSPVDTPWGIWYPSSDGHLWNFNSFDSKQVFDNFVFDTKPDSTSHGIYTGSRYSFYYNDSAYPELCIDLTNYPETEGRPTKSTQSIVASFYDNSTGYLYLSDGEYILRDEDTDASVTLTFTTPEIPVTDFTKLGNEAQLVIRANTQGANMTITPYYDGVAQDSMTAVNTSTLSFEERGIPFGTFNVMHFVVSITSSKDVVIQEPWLIRKG